MSNVGELEEQQGDHYYLIRLIVELIKKVYVVDIHSEYHKNTMQSQKTRIKGKNESFDSPVSERIFHLENFQNM